MSTPTSDGANYIASRPAPADLANTDDKDHVAVVHRIQLGADEGSAPVASAIRFPRPENVWMSRDVDRADWAAFTKHLLPRRPRANGSTDEATSEATTNGNGVADDENARRQRLNDIVGEWNRGFFEPRGLSILAQFGDDVVGATVSSEGEGDATVLNGNGNANGNGNTSNGASRGYGLKLGKSMLGVSMGPNTHGYGLRLGGVLLGVRVDQDDKTDEKEK